jgi:PKD repeat protein
MKTRFFSWMTMAVTAMMLVGCSEDPPVVEIFFEASETDPYTINFTTQSENASSFSWEFGDGETGEGAEVSHTYAASGDYSVTVTAKGDGGEATSTKEITISAGLAELIAGPASGNGKTWVLSRTATPGLDGAGSFDASFPADMMPGTDNVLDILGLGAEYDNEFTFKPDGSYEINNVDGNNLAGWQYAGVNIPMEDWVITTDVGIFSVKSTPPSGVTWTLTEDTDLTMDGVNEDPLSGDLTDKTATFESADYITFTNGGFAVLQDFIPMVIVRAADSERLTLAIFMCSGGGVVDKPSHILTLTLDAK